MTLKERLEAVWNKNEIACPSHLCIWSEHNHWFSRFSEYGLFYKRGKMLGPKKQKTKGKGFSYLHRYYRAALIVRKSDNAHK